MPTQTFYNLPEEKRAKIIDAAIDEFARKPFSSASVAGIIERAGIPRGSFYQYFADLTDLYKYVLDVAAEKKIQYLSPIIGQIGELGVLKVIRELYMAGVKFVAENPKLGEIGINLYKEPGRVKKLLMEGLEQKSQDFFYELFLTAKLQGEVDEEIDPAVASFMFNVLNLAVVEHLVQTNEVTPLEDMDGYLKMVDRMLYIFENGFKKK